MDRIICPNCKYVMVRPIRRDCPRCNYNLQEYMLQKKNKQNKKFHQFFELHRRIKLSSSFNINSPISKKINQFITLKLEKGITNIYVRDKLFRQCKRLILEIPKEDIPQYEEIESIDEAAKMYEKHLYQNRIVTGPMAVPTPNQYHNITPEQEFWGHCSNIQAWVENDYDTRILMSNLSFPLLRELARLGDPKAKKVFKEEIALRLESGYPSVVQFLLGQGYLSEFSSTEFQSILESNVLIRKLSVEPKIIVYFLISCFSNFPTLIEYILLEVLNIPDCKEILISIVKFKPKIADYKPRISYIPRYLFNIKETLENFLEQDYKDTASDIPYIVQEIEQHVQDLRSQGYLVKPPKKEGRIERNFRVILLGRSPKKSRLLTAIATPNEGLGNLLPNLIAVPIYLKEQNAKIKLIVEDISDSTYPMLRFFSKSAKAIILTFELKSVDTLASITEYYNHINISRRLNQIPMVLVGLSEDLESERSINEMAKQLSEKLNISYFRTSFVNSEEIYRFFYKIAEVSFSQERKSSDWSLNTKETTCVKVGGESFVGRFLCYLDKDIVEKMGADTGSIIEIKGKKKTVGIIVSSNKDKGTGIIRLDKLQRFNAGVNIGQDIEIRLVEEVSAEEIEITTSFTNLDNKKLMELLLPKILHKPVVSGDIIEISIKFSPKTSNDNPIVRKLLNKTFLQKSTVRIIVKNTTPANNVVKITRDTKIRVNKQILK